MSSTRRMLSPSILSSSLSLEWVMLYWNHMPSWIPRGSSHPIQCWLQTLGCREGGLPASCVGSKYLPSLSSQVARRRSLDVLGYVKSNPPGRIFNRLSLLEQIRIKTRIVILPTHTRTTKTITSCCISTVISQWCFHLLITLESTFDFPSLFWRGTAMTHFVRTCCSPLLSDLLYNRMSQCLQDIET